MTFLNKFKIQSRGLLLLLAVTFFLAASIPLINYYLIFPRYDQELISGAERDSILLAKHISRMLIGGEKEFTSESITHWTDKKAEETRKDFNLLKIKIYDSAGTVLYSSSSDEIGTLNTRDYFHKVVAKGKNFTKVVRKGHKGLEGKELTRDVVETYVPIIQKALFVGAFEIYYDITETRKELGKNFLYSMLLPLPIMALFLGGVFVIVVLLNTKIREEKQIKQELEGQKETLLADQKKQKELFGFVENAKRQWETTMDCISELVFLTDPDLSIKRCNNAVLELTKGKYPDVLGKNFHDIIPDTKIEGGEGSFGESLEFYHEPSGLWFFLSLFPVVETIDQEAGFVISMSDITSIKKMTAKLKRTNEEIVTNRNALQKALDNISKLIGDTIEGKSYKEHISFDEENKCWETMDCNQKDCPCYGKKGMRCWQESGTFCGGEVQGRFAKKYNSCIECKHFKGVTMDPAIFITEQFDNLMHMLENKNSELRLAYMELKETQAQLLQQEKMASIGQLAAGVAHEINNPVGFIASNIGSLDKYVKRLNEYISSLEESLKTVDNTEIQESLASQRKKLKLDFILEDIQDLITESLDGCDRVTKIVQDLKGFSRVDQSDRQLADMNECIDTTLNMVTNELKYKATIEKEYGTISAIECYPQQLNQVFMNILINAGHAIEEKGVITVKTWEDEAFVYTSISDTGCGMDQDQLKRIFEPFFTTKEVGKGTGLGLSIVYDIIAKNHDGDIEATSEVGVGTTFTIKLPRGTSEA